MDLFWCHLGTFTIILIYCVWRTHRGMLARKERQLRERVAYMLWVMAERVEDHEHILQTRGKAI